MVILKVYAGSLPFDLCLNYNEQNSQMLKGDLGCVCHDVVPFPELWEHDGFRHLKYRTRKTSQASMILITFSALSLWRPFFTLAS